MPIAGASPADRHDTAERPSKETGVCVRILVVKFIGASIKRLEDPRLLVGGGRYVDDLARPGMVHAVIVRSPHAHARVVHVDARRALAQKGVLACVTGADLGGVPPIPIRQGAKPGHAAYLQPPLVGDRVRYVGEPVAVVVATDRASAGGRLLALDATLVNVLGGYLRTHGVWVAALTTSYLPGPYRWPSFRCRVSCVMTNKTPTGTVRAPGFYEGTFVRERVLDLLAARLGLDPAEIRRRNLPRPSEVPYTVNTVAASVTGRDADFGGEDFGAARLVACRARNAAGGDVRFGVGLAALVETSGTGPFESARVTLTPEGTIVLATGATSLGQGLPTTLAQVCAEALQIPPADIEVHLGDTNRMPHGVGSSASRSMVMAGSAVHQASIRLREQIVALAAAHFEASPADITLEDGAAIVRGVPDRRCSLRQIAALAAAPLEAEWRHETTRAVGSFGVHLSVVGVDVTTGQVQPETHFVLCDVGRAINPTIVEAQLVGAVVQGLGHATMEELVYDPSGQLLT